MAPQVKVAVSNRVHPEVLAFLSQRFAVAANTGLDPWLPAVLAQQCADADGLLAFMTDRVDTLLLRGCPRLKVIACALKGFDNVDVAACTDHGVCVTVSPDLLTAPTAELAVGLALALCRNILPGDAHVRSGAFQGWRPHLYGFGLCGATVGVVGMGAVGRAIAARLAGFQPRLLYFDPNVPAATGASRVSWEGLLEESDLLILAAPLTPETVHLLDARALARAKPGCRIVNVGRGSVVDEAAVADALAAGRLAGYAADVFEMEDWARAGRPRRIASALLAQRDRTVFTPHLGSAVARVRLEIEMAAARDLVEGLEGRIPPNAINRPRHNAGDAGGVTGTDGGRSLRVDPPASR